MAGAPSEDYHRGEMDIHEQDRTYHSFLILSKWGSLTFIVSVMFFTLLFCTRTGFIGSAISAIVVATLGILLLRQKKNDVH